MNVIGIAGGIASGKSLVSQQLQQLGAEILDADRAGHEVLREPTVRSALVERWGERILADDREINRKVVAGIVFASPPNGPKELSFLESITHPRIGERLRKRCQQLLQEDVKAVVLDAPASSNGSPGSGSTAATCAAAVEPTRRN